MTSYYIEKDGKIIFVDTDLQRLQNTVALGEYAELEIKETDRPIVNFEFADTPEYLAEELTKAKEAKMQENATKRDEHLLAGVVYKDVLFDSDTDQKINLQFYVPNMSDTDTVIWFGKDNQPLKCTKEDLMAIGGLISSLTAQVWSVKNPAYVEAINNATTIEELNAINIDYN
jgi:hypothetical protein